MLISKSETTNRFGVTVTKAHVKYNGTYYIVSDNSKEVIIFSSDKDGGCKYVQVGDGLGSSLDEVTSNIGNFIFHNMGSDSSWMEK